MTLSYPYGDNSRGTSGGASLAGDHNLSKLYTTAQTNAELALEVVEELIGAVEQGEDCEFQSAALQSYCERIALTDARIQVAQQAIPTETLESGQRIMAAAERYMQALNRLCERVRAAEQTATVRLRTLSPGLDASIRGKQMIVAYRQRRA